MYCALQMFVLFLEAPGNTALYVNGRGRRRRSSFFGRVLRSGKWGSSSSADLLLIRANNFSFSLCLEKLQSVFVVLS